MWLMLVNVTDSTTSQLLLQHNLKKVKNRTDVFENMSGYFPVLVYLARQVNDAECYGLARLRTAHFCLPLIVLPTRSLVQIRSDRVNTADKQNRPLSTCEALKSLLRLSTGLCRWTWLWGWGGTGNDMSVGATDKRQLQEEWCCSEEVQNNMDDSEILIAGCWWRTT